MSVVIDGTSGITAPIYSATVYNMHQNSQVISTNYTIPASTNAMSAGPITVGTGYVITVTTGSRWVIV